MSGDAKVFLVRIFDGYGDDCSFQCKAIDAAFGRFDWFRNFEDQGVTFKIEKLTNQRVKNTRSDISKLEDIIDWLVGRSDGAKVHAYILPCHIHQGFQAWDDSRSWKTSMIGLKEYFKVLPEHGNGLPNQHQINCPVFTQDKFDYLRHIYEFTNPTLKIEVKESYSSEEMTQIEAFWDVYCSDQSQSGCVLKAPFTTNRTWIKFPKHFLKLGTKSPSVVGTLEKAFKDFGADTIPYIMMQPCIDKIRKREKKVVFLGGVASHITTGYSVGVGFPFDDSSVIKFAQQAYDTLRQRIGPNHWLDQLARVDVMYNEFEDRMVVNEIESLQASYEMQGSSISIQAYDLKVMTFLTEYYITFFEESILPKLKVMARVSKKKRKL